MPARNRKDVSDDLKIAILAHTSGDDLSQDINSNRSVYRSNCDNKKWGKLLFLGEGMHLCHLHNITLNINHFLIVINYIWCNCFRNKRKLDLFPPADKTVDGKQRWLHGNFDILKLLYEDHPQSQAISWKWNWRNLMWTLAKAHFEGIWRKWAWYLALLPRSHCWPVVIVLFAWLLQIKYVNKTL